MNALNRMILINPIALIGLLLLWKFSPPIIDDSFWNLFSVSIWINISMFACLYLTYTSESVTMTTGYFNGIRNWSFKHAFLLFTTLLISVVSFIIINASIIDTSIVLILNMSVICYTLASFIGQYMMYNKLSIIYV